MFVRPYLSILAILGALLGAGVAARAQTYPLPTAPAANAAPASGQAGAQHPARRRFRMVLRQLGLSQDQRAQIRSMMQSFRASRATDAPMTRKQLLAQIEGVLTPAQRTQFDAAMHPYRRAVPPPAPQNS